MLAESGLFNLTLPDTSRCRRIVDAERPPTPWETGGGSVMVEGEKLADTSSTGEKILRKLSQNPSKMDKDMNIGLKGA